MTSIDAHLFLRARHSIRRFRQKPVDADTLKRIIVTATHAPSAHNRQPWRFSVLTAPEAKTRLSDAMAADFARDLAADGLTPEQIAKRVQRSKDRIAGAPVIIILCMDPSEMDIYLDAKRHAHEITMATQSVAAAGTTLLLAAHAEGLGGVWTCGPLFAPEIVRTVLNLPSTWQPQAMFFMGYPDEECKPKELKPLDDIILFN